jgi:hypothetical protein
VFALGGLDGRGALVVDDRPAGDLVDDWQRAIFEHCSVPSFDVRVPPAMSASTCAVVRRSSRADAHRARPPRPQRVTFHVDASLTFCVSNVCSGVPVFPGRGQRRSPTPGRSPRGRGRGDRRCANTIGQASESRWAVTSFAADQGTELVVPQAVSGFRLHCPVGAAAPTIPLAFALVTPQPLVFGQCPTVASGGLGLAFAAVRTAPAVAQVIPLRPARRDARGVTTQTPRHQYRGEPGANAGVGSAGSGPVRSFGGSTG